MNLTSRLAAVGLLAATAGACATTASQTRPPSAALDTLFAEYWEQLLALSPLTATYVGDRRYDDRLPIEGTPERRAQWREFHQDWLARIERTPAGDARDALNREIFLRDRRDELAGMETPAWMVPLNQFYNLAGQYAQLGSGTSAQRFDSVAAYEHWLARAAQIPVQLEQVQVNLRHGIERGVVQPRVLMERVVEQLDALIHDDPEQTLFFRPVQQFPEAVPEADRQRLREAYRRMIATALMPAYRELRDFVRDEYLPHARSTDGLWAVPGGEQWYAYLVRRYTTTDLSPDQIHEIGLAEVARIHGQMRAIMREVGFDGELADFFAYVTSDPRFTFESEQALLDAYEALRERVDARVGDLFDLVPKAGFEIRPVEPFRARSAAGGSYSRPSQDGSRPGIFYVNTYDLPSRKTWDIENLYLHEAIPGHHFQIALQQELEDLPAFRRFGGYTAFVEGWALYAESLGPELGLYRDPYSRFGALQAELWRAIRLVVDTGLHHKRWTREQVIDYMLANSAASRTEAVSETERYMAIPGQALAYKIGQLRILELRRRAEQRLGERFDIRAFHREVLRDGAVPLDVLERKIDRWIAAQLA